MRTRMISFQMRRPAITFAVAVLAIAIVMGLARTNALAETTVNESWALPDSTGKGFVLTIGDRSVYTPRLMAGSLTVSIHDSAALYTFSTSEPECPGSSHPVVAVDAWSPGLSASTTMSATISGTVTGVDGSSMPYQETLGPVAVQPSLDSGLSLPPVEVCEGDSEQPAPTPSPSPTTSPTPDASPSPSPTASPTPAASPTPTPSPSPTASPTPEPSPTPQTTPTPDASPSPTPEPQPSPSACTRGCSKPAPKKCDKKDC